MGPQEVARGWNNANMDDEEVPEGYKVVFRLGSDPRTTQTSSLGYSSTQQYLHGDHISPSADPLQLVCHYPIRGRATREQTRSQEARQRQDAPQSQEVVDKYCTEKGTDPQYAIPLTARANETGLIIQKLKALLGEIQNAKARVCIEKVKGHNGDREGQRPQRG
jgi:hypothetical protein